MKTTVRLKSALILGAALWSLAAGPAATATVSVYWDPVTRNDNNSVITDLKGYRVFSAPFSMANLTPATALTMPGVITSTVTSLTGGFAVTGLNSGTLYYFRLTAFNTGDTQSDWSLPQELSMTTPELPTVPGKPDLTVLSDRGIHLAWADNSNNEDGFRIERALNGGAFETVTTVGPNATASVTYSDDGDLEPASNYTYRVVAKNAAGDAPSAVSDSASTSARPPSRPAAPMVPAPAVVSSSRIDLSWTDNSIVPSKAEGFHIERSVRSDFSPAADLIVDVGPGVTSYADTGLAAGTLYYFRVRAYNSALNPNSDYVTVSAQTLSATAPPPTPPAAPGTPTLAALSASGIRVTWTDQSSNESGFRIERSLDGLSFTTVTTVGANQTTYPDGTLTPATTYYYRVVAKNAVGEAASVISALARTFDAPTAAPTTPAAFSAVVVSSVQVNLSWTDNSSGSNQAESFHLERSRDGGFNPVEYTVNLVAGITAYPNAGLTPGTTYYFRVRAHNSAPSGDSNYAAPVMARTADAVVTLSGLSAPPGLKESYAYPNPAKGVDPVIRAIMGGVDLVEITIFDQSGHSVLSDRVTQMTTVNGQAVYEYKWTGEKRSGTYYAGIHGKKGGETVRARTKFAVVR